MNETTKNFPPSASHGGDNAYYLKGCDQVGHQPSYAACLWKIAETEASRPNSLFGSCPDEIRSGRCQAINMRQEEQLKGVALYYFPRQFIQHQVITNLTPAENIPRVSKPVSRPVTTLAATTSKAPQTAQDKEFDGDQGYAAAINAAMQETLASAGPSPGDTPIDRTIKAASLPNFTQPESQPALRTNTRLPINPGESPLQYARRIAATKTTTTLENI
ncbi:hypothetical protein QN372_00605 [Undibacterium sp. RTI2.1]|uniref:hypothetical protein n=1 Tax=unclassified Undibacterium TaxID=2630295 RepID=UPI002AB3BB8D|nr:MULTISPECIES: hypothetical protein [unclassified Undibacterium]MDY7537639.1 hypothetical protein [Undibacterium sp. 5I1]MEB0029240.1 hypothetical protein [Undibacterium sp. RTI2.1]MEB0115548.1 hypothetical protein [Undibacterium sp. RTI2.2]MEB0230184.1 hypothetical protein [Undibacterium sp. 10I3]MEB0256376.1 hypothetical protein [Undibacterium sp. 5I1]